MVKNKEVDGFVSAGNTGAVLSGATLLVGRIKGVQRPALTVALPSGEIPVLVLDIGANMDSKPSYLVQYAKMCEIYCRKLYGIAKPSVGLLNVGVEPGKGNALSKEVYELLMAEKEQGMNFIGNVEAREVFSGDMNIVVTDAFAGNVLLKNTEGVVAFIFKALKKAMYSNLRSKIGALLLKPALMELKSQLDPRAVGGTPLLGVDGAVIKAHGNSNDVAISSAVKQCLSFIKTEVNEEIRANLKKEPKAE
jgi:glycerol-3-phosphate acyltransferase PlsX